MNGQVLYVKYMDEQGASLLRMIETVLGQNVLRQALMDYLNEHKFSNAETDDLWRALSRSTNDTVNIKVTLFFFFC